MDNLVKSVAIIPARGGSKRIPNKNIIDFMGKPMIAWTIEAALQTQLFQEVLVSTDSESIAEIAKEYGAIVPFLRNSYADDNAPVSLATLAALKQLENEFETQYENIVQLMPNCPLRDNSSIENQINAFLKLETKVSILSGFKYGMFNPWWAHKMNEDGTYSKILNVDKNTRSQDLPELICPTGATWITTSRLLKKTETFYSSSYTFFEIDWKEAVDIDDNHDLEIAKAAYYLKHAL